MVFAPEYDFTDSIAYAGDRGMTIRGQYGYARNEGSTELGMIEIFDHWKVVS